MKKSKKPRWGYVVVGVNEGQLTPTWFYLFKSWRKASKFVDDETSGGVRWNIYACPMETSVRKALKHLRHLKECTK